MQQDIITSGLIITKIITAAKKGHSKSWMHSRSAPSCVHYKWMLISSPPYALVLFLSLWSFLDLSWWSWVEGCRMGAGQQPAPGPMQHVLTFDFHINSSIDHACVKHKEKKKAAESEKQLPASIKNNQQHYYSENKNTNMLLAHMCALTSAHILNFKGRSHILRHFLRCIQSITAASKSSLQPSLQTYKGTRTQRHHIHLMWGTAGLWMPTHKHGITL